MINEDDITTAIITLMRTKWDKGYRYYTKEETEGYVMPCFFVDTHLNAETPAGANNVHKDITIIIDYYQKVRDQELTHEAVDGLRELLLSNGRNSRHLILKVKDRYLSVNSYSFAYVGQSNNIPEIEINIEFNDTYMKKDTTSTMREIYTQEVIL